MAAPGSSRAAARQADPGTDGPECQVVMTLAAEGRLQQARDRPAQ